MVFDVNLHLEVHCMAPLVYMFIFARVNISIGSISCIYNNRSKPINQETITYNTIFVLLLIKSYIFFVIKLLLLLSCCHAGWKSVGSLRFSFTFSRIQANTDLYWSSQRYFLIKEYHERPPLAPPLIIVWHLFQLVSQCCLRGCTTQPPNDFR